MPLTTYADARPWAKAIRDEVLNRRMPPWDAVKGVGEFRDDPSLSQPEMDLFVNWVEGGAPEGDEIYLPPERRFEELANQAEREAALELSRPRRKDDKPIQRGQLTGGSQQLGLPASQQPVVWKSTSVHRRFS